MIYSNVGSSAIGTGWVLSGCSGCKFPKIRLSTFKRKFRPDRSCNDLPQMDTKLQTKPLRLNFLGSAEKALPLSVRKKSVEIDC